MISTIWVSGFLIYNLSIISAQRRVSPKQWLFKLPLSMQLAVGMLILSVGTLIRSASIWIDRALSDGALSSLSWTGVGLLAGAFIAVCGFMCILRVVSKPVLGHWPWVSAVAAMLIYIAVWCF